MKCVICKQEITADPLRYIKRLAQYNVQLKDLQENNDDHIIQSDLEDGIADIESKVKGAE